MNLNEYAAQWVDMVPHTATLTALARDAQTIVEWGVRGGVSTWALLDGLPSDGRMVSVDIDGTVPVPDRVSGDPRWTLLIGDDRTVDVPVADLVVIDTSHEYDHTLAELHKAAQLGAKRIALHDPIMFPDVDHAIAQFLPESAYRLERFEVSAWGLAVLVLR